MSSARVEEPAYALPQSSERVTVGDYLAVTKPKHQFVLVTCWATMVLAPTTPSWWLAGITTIATVLAVASSHVFNQLLDRDVDAVMTRTRNRPIASGRMSVRAAIMYGTALGALALVLMIWQVNLLSAVLVLVGLFVYDVIYSYWLKRTSSWCTLVGGVAGAIPTLIGWAAVTGRLDVVPLILFSFMVIWQCPHFFALSLFKDEEYRRAKLPVLVVVKGKPATLRRLIGYTLLLVASTVLLYFTGAVGEIFLGVALSLGITYLTLAIRAIGRGEAEFPLWGRRLFLLSYAYLFVIFATAVLDRTA